MYDAFISYRRIGGTAIAKLLREMLKNRGVTAFMDLDELRGGTFDDKLIDTVRRSPAFILILPPGALDRCHRKGDWLTREIVAAVESHPAERVVPVMCDGFTWPRRWKRGVPPQVRQLARYNGVMLDYHYLDATVDAIVERVQGFSGPTAGTSLSDLDTFFRNRMREPESIRGVDLAFHAGAQWHVDEERLGLLEDMAGMGAPIRILLNTPEAAESIGRHMRRPGRHYTAFSEAVELWKAFAARFGNVEVRLSGTPLLRIYYRFHMDDPALDAIRVKYYTYGNSQIARNFSRNFEPEDTHFALYQAEFDVLWNNAGQA